MSRERLVVIGGDAAGMSAASEARRRRTPDALEIVAFERGLYTSYSCALWNEMAVDEIAHLDLGYAPPFSPVWDPVLIAARKAWAAIEHASSDG